VSSLTVPHAGPPSPPAARLRGPSWLNVRLVVGMLLVTVSVLIGARIVASADRSVRVWALSRDVSAGTLLADADVRPARVRLFDSAPAYLQVSRSPAGRMVTRALRAGELLPAAALDTPPPAAIVSIPVSPDNASGVARGQLVDVWSNAKGCAPVQVLAGVAVQDVRASGGALSVTTGALQVIVRVDARDARRLVMALATDGTVRLVVLDGAPSRRSTPIGAPDVCAPAGGVSRPTYGPTSAGAGSRSGLPPPRAGTPTGGALQPTTSASPGRR
jgi:SAF domain